MKLLALSLKEAQDILSNKIYLLVIFVQIFIILGAFGLAIVTSVATDPALLDSYGITSNLKVGVDSDINKSELANYLQDERFTVIYYDNSDEASKYLGKGLIAVIFNNSQGEIIIQSDNS
ncbi:MAG: ABC transporter permease, partial [Methanobacterium sp.]|nr:ABC transporter permease [Methanobacterium sp.]